MMLMQHGAPLRQRHDHPPYMQITLLMSAPRVADRSIWTNLNRPWDLMRTKKSLQKWRSDPILVGIITIITKMICLWWIHVFPDLCRDLGCLGLHLISWFIEVPGVGWLIRKTETDPWWVVSVILKIHNLGVLKRIQGLVDSGIYIIIMVLKNWIQ